MSLSIRHAARLGQCNKQVGQPREAHREVQVDDAGGQVGGAPILRLPPCPDGWVLRLQRGDHLAYSEALLSHLQEALWLQCTCAECLRPPLPLSVAFPEHCSLR